MSSSSSLSSQLPPRKHRQTAAPKLHEAYSHCPQPLQVLFRSGLSAQHIILSHDRRPTKTGVAQPEPRSRAPPPLPIPLNSQRAKIREILYRQRNETLSTRIGGCGKCRVGGGFTPTGKGWRNTGHESPPSGKQARDSPRTLGKRTCCRTE